MVNVKELKVMEHNFQLKKGTNVEFDKCLKMVPELLTLLPKKSKYIVSFELVDTNVDVANAIRRCLTNEIPIKSLDYVDDEKNVQFSDLYILSDLLKQQIELVPIDQNVEENTMLSLKVSNNTDSIINVSTHDFKVVSPPNLKVEDLMEDIVLGQLRPQGTLTIKKVGITEGKAKSNSAAFNSLASIKYEILDTKPLYEEKGKSSMVSDPSHFRIEYSTHRNFTNPLYPMIKCCNELISRLESIVDAMKPIQNKDTFYFSDFIKLETEGSTKTISISDESWTITNLLTRNCIELSKNNILFVTPSIIHPDKAIGQLKITHPEFSDLIQNAAKKAIKDLQTIESSFKGSLPKSSLRVSPKGSPRISSKKTK